MDREKKVLPLDAAVAIILILIVLLLAFEGLAVQRLPKEALGFPVFVFTVIAVVGCLELLRIWKVQKADGQSMREQKIQERKAEGSVFYNLGNFLVICSLVLGYLALMWFVGFIVSTIVFAVSFAVKFRFGHPVIFAVMTIFVTVGLYYVFKNVMYIHLPGGFLLDLIS